MGDSTCVQCGECVQVCPVGALVLKQPREWQDPAARDRRRPRSPARTAASGCQIDLHTKDNKYVFAMAHEGQWERQPNKGMLCIKGRFGLDFVDSPDRLRTPLVRKDGELVEASWDEALDLVAERLQGHEGARTAPTPSASSPPPRCPTRRTTRSGASPAR